MGASGEPSGAFQDNRFQGTPEGLSRFKEGYFGSQFIFTGVSRIVQKRFKASRGDSKRNKGV